MQLDKKKRTHLKSLGHHLNPVVRVGQKGLTEAVNAELDIALNHHELVKIKVAGADRETRAKTIEQLAADNAAQLVHSIGQTALLFRRNEKQPVIVFPS